MLAIFARIKPALRRENVSASRRPSRRSSKSLASTPKSASLNLLRFAPELRCYGDRAVLTAANLVYSSRTTFGSFLLARGALAGPQQVRSALRVQSRSPRQARRGLHRLRPIQPTAGRTAASNQLIDSNITVAAIMAGATDGAIMATATVGAITARFIIAVAMVPYAGYLSPRLCLS
jgi:hypothetical protein